MSDPAAGLRLRAEILRASVSIFAALTAVGLPVETEGTQQIYCPNPQHPEQHASARVYADSNHVHCFTCGKTWDVVGLIMVVRHVSFAEAVAWAEAVFGISTADGLAVVAALDVIPVRADPMQRVPVLSAAIRARHGTVPARTYHRWWLVLDTAVWGRRERTLDAEDFEDALDALEAACRS